MREGGSKGLLELFSIQTDICIKFINFKSTKSLRYKNPTLTLMAYGFYWGRQCSWTLTTANSMQVSNMQSNDQDIFTKHFMYSNGIMNAS